MGPIGTAVMTLFKKKGQTDRQSGKVLLDVQFPKRFDLKVKAL